MNGLQPEKYRQDLEIIRLTAEQVIRDLGVFGIEIAFSGNPYTAYEELEKQLQPVFKRMYEQDTASFQALLYRIDLEEREYRRLLAGPDFISRLTAAVLEREFKKIIIRKYFQQTGGSDAG